MPPRRSTSWIPQLEQTTLIRAFEHCLPPERLMRGVTLPQLGERLRDGARVADGTAAVILDGLAAHILLPYAEAVPIMRRAVEELLVIEDDRELLRLGAVGVALTTALWDHRGRDACLQRAAEAARAAGSLQLLDTALWILSLAELTGGTPRRAGAYIDQVRELRRAIGYPAEHVVNAAYLAWVGAPRPQIEAVAEAMRQAGFGGVHASAVAALALRDLAEGHYRDAYQRLRAVDRGPVPAGHPAGVPGLRRSRGPSRSSGRGAAGGGQVDGDGRSQRVGVDPGCGLRSRALVEPEPEELYREAIETLAGARLVVDLARAELLYGEWLRRRRRRREARVQLSSAMGRLEQAGATVFAARARTELEATGVRLSAECTGHPRADAPGSQRGSARSPGTDQRRDQLDPVRQRQHRRLPPAQGVPEARHLLPPSARRPSRWHD